MRCEERVAEKVGEVHILDCVVQGAWGRERVGEKKSQLQSVRAQNSNLGTLMEELDSHFA